MFHQQHQTSGETTRDQVVLNNSQDGAPPGGPINLANTARGPGAQSAPGQLGQYGPGGKGVATSAAALRANLSQVVEQLARPLGVSDNATPPSMSPYSVPLQNLSTLQAGQYGAVQLQPHLGGSTNPSNLSRIPSQQRSEGPFSAAAGGAGLHGGLVQVPGGMALPLQAVHAAYRQSQAQQPAYHLPQNAQQLRNFVQQTATAAAMMQARHNAAQVPANMQQRPAVQSSLNSRQISIARPGASFDVAPGGGFGTIMPGPSLDMSKTHILPVSSSLPMASVKVPPANLQYSSQTITPHRLHPPSAPALPPSVTPQPVNPSMRLSSPSVARPVGNQAAPKGQEPEGPLKASALSGIGFSEAQLHVLKHQIMAFRALKKGDRTLPPQLLAACNPQKLKEATMPAEKSKEKDKGHKVGKARTPSPAPQGAQRLQGLASGPGSVPKAAGKSNANSKASTPGPRQTTPASSQLASTGKTAKSAPGAGQDAKPQVEVRPVSRPVRRWQQPLYAVGAPPVQDPSRPAPENHLQYHVSQVVRDEQRRVMIRRRKSMIKDLQKRLKASSTRGFVSGPDGAPGRAALLLEIKKLKLLELQMSLRRAVENEQEEVMKMGERQYKKFVRDCNKQRYEMMKVAEKEQSEKWNDRAQGAKRALKNIQDRAALSRELRAARNKAMQRLHERLARDLNKIKDDVRARRLAALKANDLQAYQELLREQQGPQTGEDRLAEIEKFLSGTEEYLHKLAAKVASVKISQEASEAVAEAIAEATAKGLSEEEVQAEARRAAQEAAEKSDVVRKSNTLAGDAQSRYYALAHSVEETITAQPSLLRPPGGAKLREYQMVGLQWMVSLYNNHLNGILADEMGLGKTVQVMALIAFLMEHKNNYGPHLIIVPNAVIVNWKSELTQWLPSVRCVYYVGHKEERARVYSQQVQSMQFNVLVTTYEYIMRDRAKLSKVEWKYIIIDEAQRMKDRQSKLAKDLDRFTTARRLLLTGTPLQNELKELWSLLNLLLPQVFDEMKQFTEWFGEYLGSLTQEGGVMDDWMKEKRVVVIHRLHQILEPFMLRRQVQDVEGRLPPKVALTVKVPMSTYQSTIYDWVKTTGTIRLDPMDPRVHRSRHDFAPLNNKVMELRKVCNHPLLSYPADLYIGGENLVRHCGKMWVLDRLLVKLYHSGHRVLLFSTMTRLLDLLEMYLQWRRINGDKRLHYARIDGATALEDRESAIKEFNKPDSQIFIFLLSIRAAGRGLNLQSSDTVIIYDPDPNPKNEEQAIARSHRIGQTKEVRVVHFEAVANPTEEEYSGPRSPPDLTQEAPRGTQKQLYADSVESLVRNNIQKMKIDMANEVIDAGRFDMQTSMDERRKNLEAMLQDEERVKVAKNEAPSMRELNRMMARSEEEFHLFCELDETEDWPGGLSGPEDVPEWLKYSKEQLHAAVELTRKKPSRATASKSKLVPNAAAPAFPSAEFNAGPVSERQPSKWESNGDERVGSTYVRPGGASELQGSAMLGGSESKEEDETAAIGGDDNDMEEEVLGENIDEDAVTVNEGGLSTRGGYEEEEDEDGGRYYSQHTEIDGQPDSDLAEDGPCGRKRSAPEPYDYYVDDGIPWGSQHGTRKERRVGPSTDITTSDVDGDRSADGWRARCGLREEGEGGEPEYSAGDPYAHRRRGGQKGRRSKGGEGGSETRDDWDIAAGTREPSASGMWVPSTSDKDYRGGRRRSSTDDLEDDADMPGSAGREALPEGSGPFRSHDAGPPGTSQLPTHPPRHPFSHAVDNDPYPGRRSPPSREPRGARGPALSGGFTVSGDGGISQPGSWVDQGEGGPPPVKKGLKVRFAFGKTKK